MRKGFTLVELSIVLVIIGLLIGGILAAQSMISAARLQSFVRQMQQYDIAVSNFRTNFNCIPGDCATVAPGGDGDGKVEEFTSGQDDHFVYEIANFWYHLSFLNFINEGVVYSANATSGIRRGVNTPKVALGHDSGIVVITEYENFGVGAHGYVDLDGKALYQIYSTAKTIDNSLSPAFDEVIEDSLAVTEMISVENKIDDGNAATGNVRASGASEHTRGEVNNAIGTGCVEYGDSSKYQISSTAKYPCSMLIVVLSAVKGS